MVYFPRTSTSRFLISFGLLASVTLIGIAGTASAQDHRQNAPGEFDFYVLSLSWSPSYCEEASERGRNGRSQQIQCGGPRPVAAIRARLSGLLPAAGAAARAQHRVIDAGPDAGARADFQ